MEYGLIGMPLGHSFSQEIHESLGWYPYELHPLEKKDFAAFMEARNFRGINVTIPYKQDVIPYLDEIDPLAADIGAVNCIVNRAGKLHGYNTDLAGMQALAEKLGLDLRGKKILICGTGGTSKTARTMARAAGARCVLRLSRTAKNIAGSSAESISTADEYADVITYAQAYNDHTDANIIINTTPSGMFPHNGEWAINAAAFPQLEGVIDAVYNPLETALVQQARALGVPAEGGLYMLVAQAVVAARHFMAGTTVAAGAPSTTIPSTADATATSAGAPASVPAAVPTSATAPSTATAPGTAIPSTATATAPTSATAPGTAATATATTPAAATSGAAETAAKAAAPFPQTEAEVKALCDRIFFALERSKRNIVLVGMPGCGKTTVGILLSQKTKRPFVDTDALIREISGKTPAQIIEEAGEEAFRALETQAIREAGKKNGCIIATGGGAVLRNENIAALRQNGIIYFIDRPLDQLAPTSDRPLSNSADKLVQLYDERYPRYAACADITIPVTADAASVAQTIETRHFS